MKLFAYYACDEEPGAQDDTRKRCLFLLYTSRRASELWGRFGGELLGYAAYPLALQSGSEAEIA